jgi:ABC-type transport system substrate-binding protein
MLRNCKLQIENFKLQIGIRVVRPRSAARYSAIRNLQFAIFILQLFSLCWATSPSIAQQKPPGTPARLIDRTPFDVVILNQENDGQRLEVDVLDLPQRPLTTLPTEGAITVRLLERPLEEFQVAWTSIAQVRVYEQLLVDEAKRLTAAGSFDEAYDYLARLQADYPALPGLKDAVSDYLRRNALALYQANQHDRALAVLVSLHQHDPSFAGLAGAVQAVANQIIESYLRSGDYAAARSVLDLWNEQFAGLASDEAATWQRRFEAAAARQLDDARRLLGEKQYVAARKAIARAQAIWPELPAAGEIASQIQREFPFITVGVLEAAPKKPEYRFDNWAALRTSRLVQRLLAEEVDFGAEGGVYRCPFGEWLLDESGRDLILKLNDDTSAVAASRIPTADSITRYLLALAQPGAAGYRSDLHRLIAGISIEPQTASLRIHLSQVHVRPEAAFQVPPPSAVAAGDFAVAEHDANQVLFAANQNGRARSAGLHAVIEQRFPNDESAVAALVAGDVDVLDRVPPWQVERLRAASGIRVGTYRLPTVHVLIPNFSRPLPAKREFRRALCFGIDRQWIVERIILGGAEIAGFDVLSGPFPSGLSHSDPIRYGYNSQIAPRPFEPRLAAILAAIAWSTLQNVDEKSGEEGEATVTTDVPELVLAHPNEPAALLACQAIQSQLGRAGIPIKLQAYASDELLAGRVDCDLRYAELAVWEPVTDARRIMGPSGLSGEMNTPYLEAALRELDAATNWNNVRNSLAELHEIASHELPVIPLWQTVNFFAYRTSIEGIGESPVTLYQDVDQWRAGAAGNVAQLQSGQ